MKLRKGRRLVATLCVMAQCALVAPALRAQAPTPAAREGPAKGDTVPAFDAEDLNGIAQHVAFPKGTTTVLLFFLSSCPTCHRMIPLWNSAYERRPKGLHVLAVLLDREPPGFFMATPISFPVLRGPGKTPAEKRAFSERLKVQRVPVTLRVASGGMVEDVGLGLLDPIRLGELFRP